MHDDLSSSRTVIHRMPARGHYDFATVAAILDAGFLCHVGFVVDGQPYVIPTCYGREGHALYLHGSSASRMLGTLAGGAPVCVTVTHVDGIVVARSGYHSSINYRSAVILGTAEPLAAADKAAALRVIVERIVPGRWEALRPVRDDELAVTTVLRVDIAEASAKIRTGPPLDDEADCALPIWAGVIPLCVAAGEPLPDQRLAAGGDSPESVGRWGRK
jgi:nitroimidazol reductase NimA-like FMN-containing flavoprotein (pyridoxamine 5'-phosphate oxidase superfamily)